MKKNKYKIPLLFLCSLVFYNCEKEDYSSGTVEDTIENAKIETVAVEEAIGLFKNDVSMKSALSKSSSIYEVVPNFEEIVQEGITNSEEQLTIIPIKTPYKEVNTRVLMLRINGEVKSVAFNMVPSETGKGPDFTGKVFITELDGSLLYGYEIEKGDIVTFLKKDETSNTTTSKDVTLKSLHLMNKGPGGSEGETDDCPYLDPSWCKLKGVTVYGNRNTGSNPYTRGISLAGIFNTNQNNNTYTPPTSTGNSWNYWRGNNLPPKEKKTWYFDNDGDGYHSLTKTATTQTSSKWKLTTKGKDCDDTNPNKTTNCNKKPCMGDPVPNPEIASSGVSGRKGGTFGCTRINQAKTCGGIKGKKKHDGLDIKANVNDDAFAMYSGTISSIRNTFSPGQYKEDSYGNFVVITSVINGVTHNIKYNHLNSVSVTKGQKINAGDIIGLTGNTGNANPPKGFVVPHIHIQVFNSNWSQRLDPAAFLKTKFDSNNNPISNNCI